MFLTEMLIRLIFHAPKYFGSFHLELLQGYSLPFVGWSYSTLELILLLFLILT